MSRKSVWSESGDRFDRALDPFREIKDSSDITDSLENETEVINRSDRDDLPRLVRDGEIKT